MIQRELRNDDDDDVEELVLSQGDLVREDVFFGCYGLSPVSPQWHQPLPAEAALGQGRSKQELPREGL